jgi:minor extracellular serine protease Vpr
MKSLSLALLSIVSLALSVGCSVRQENGEVGFASKKDGKLFANRPTAKENILSVIKLKSPALLEVAQIGQDGKPVVESLQLQAIADEQTAMIQKLQALSPEVKVLNQYRFVLNAIAVWAPASLEAEIRSLGGFSYIEREGQFGRPTVKKSSGIALQQALTELDSTTFIGSQHAHAQGIKGQGISVGVIDTGIDYTHSAMGGVGSSDLYESIDPSQPHEAYPNAKVVGGIDLVGTIYDASSPVGDLKLPRPDANPLDEGGHGTHVAGSVAGIGDGVNTYNGVAPDALLHAIKVFGKDGSTGDSVVLAALEYSIDPNSDGNPSDALDVVNLSLGSSYGKPHLLYSEAVKNLSRGGVVVVASAGNSGHEPFITGAPATSAEAISVAASVDGMEHNWKFDGIKFETVTGAKWLAEAVEASFTKPISEIEELKGKLVYVGLANADFTPEQAAALKGNIALISRGQVSFGEKIKRAAKAEARGVIVFNNAEGSAFVMGGDEKIAIPAVMIPKSIGDQLVAASAQVETTVDFKSTDKIEKPELIDTLTDFTSRGPRSIDGLIKPEISAPGSSIISAEMGGGTLGVKMSGTSMAGPHMAGVMALMKQKYPKAPVSTLKSLVMGTAKIISDDQKQVYPVALQGAGRVQVEKAVNSVVYASPASLSLGVHFLGKTKRLARELTLHNLSDESVTYSLRSVGAQSLKVLLPETVTLAAGESKTLALKFEVAQVTDTQVELDGRVELLLGDQVAFHVPYLLIGRKVSEVSQVEGKIYASSMADQVGAEVELSLKNSATQEGRVLAFNLLGKDERQYRQNSQNSTRSTACDLQSAGYRVVTRQTAEGEKTLLQVAVKTYQPLTRWQACDLSVLIDGDGDGQPDQELAGIMRENLDGLSGNTYTTVLLDFKAAREIRKEYELARASGQGSDRPDYTPAVLDQGQYQTFNYSTLAIVETEVSLLARAATGELAIKVVLTNEDSAAIEHDDYLSGTESQWRKVQLDSFGQSYLGLEEVYVLAPQERKTLTFVKGQGTDQLVLYYPDNFSTLSETLQDSAQEVLSLPYVY